MIKIIVADDHAVLRQALSELLTAHGKFYVSTQASSGEELLKILETETPDAIIIDIAMPGMGGLATMEQIKSRGKEIPMLVLSADESRDVIQSALRIGAKGFVPKNAGIEELEFALEAVVAGKTYLSPSITSKLMSEDGTEICDNASPCANLTKRELEIVKLLANGKSHKEISQELHISSRTVDTHRSNILKKLALKNNAELTKFAISFKLISV